MLPDAPNAQAVREMLDGARPDKRVKARSPASLWIRVPATTPFFLIFPEESERYYAQGDIGVVLAKIGDAQGAKQSANTVPVTYSEILRDIAVAHWL